MTPHPPTPAQELAKILGRMRASGLCWCCDGPKSHCGGLPCASLLTAIAAAERCAAAEAREQEEVAAGNKLEAMRLASESRVRELTEALRDVRPSGENRCPACDVEGNCWAHDPIYQAQVAQEEKTRAVLSASPHAEARADAKPVMPEAVDNLVYIAEGCARCSPWVGPVESHYAPDPIPTPGCGGEEGR